MLSYFPTPYPGEWWYSVLCRYFVRSGVRTEATILRELYGAESINHGLLFPGPSCVLVQRNLPTDFITLKDIFLKHTLLPYYMRMASQEKKQAVLQQCINGTNPKITQIDLCSMVGMRGPKFCPVCYQQDREKYGEAYWHREHQIPLMPLCPEHECRLEQPETDWVHRMMGFLPLELIACPQLNIEQKTWERLLTKVLNAYVKLPYSVGPDKRYNNLIEKLMSQGYTISHSWGHDTLDTAKLYQDLGHFFGTAIMDKFFSPKDNLALYHLELFSLNSPERYALLEAFSGLTPEEFFGPDLSSGKRTINRFRHK